MNGRAERAGSEIRAICGKCGDVWHVVVAMTGERIAQVQCGECGARHRYRPSGAAVRARSIARKSPKPRSRAQSAPVVEADPSRPPRAFSPRDSYRVGDRVVHPSFGEGVVQAVVGATKVDVLFDAGTKRLVQGRGAG